MSISTDFVENINVNGEQYQYVGIESTVDIKYELPRQLVPVKLLDDQNQDDQEDNVGDSDGGAVDAEETLDYGGIGGQPVSELKDPLEQILDEQLTLKVLKSTPEGKTILTGSSLTPIRQTKPKLKKIKTTICIKCDTGFPSPFLFEQHMIQVHQDDRPYPCKVCEKPFTKRGELKRHETIHNPNRFKGDPQYSCDICGKRYHIKGSMEAHKKKNHLGYKPPKKHYIGPVKQHHSTSGVKNPNPYRKPKEIHQCPHCDLTFKMKCLLKNHMTCHTKERPFLCPICQQSFAKKTVVKSHIRTVHHLATPSGMRHPRPKWQAKQPSPCTTCGKEFATPSLLASHILLHTGEKPHVCSECGKKFRLKHDLNCHIKRNHLKDKLFTNPLKLFKCRICGRDDLLFFNDLNKHRQTYHRHIPFDSENEKPFGCGICGKPYYLREGALICALLGHDPTSLRKAMFKHKCSECPSENFGYHNLTFLRRHWEMEHGDKKLPVQFRVGMYSKNLKADELPTCGIDRVKKDNIKLNGPPRKDVKSEGALYTEFDLLPIPEEERFFRKGMDKVVYGYKHKCTICRYQAQTSRNLETHVQNAHVKRKVKLGLEHICSVCGKKMSSAFNLRRHGINVHGPRSGTKRNGWRRKVGTESGRIIDMETVPEIPKELEKGVIGESLHDSKTDNWGKGENRVDIGDKARVKAILNFQSVQVKLHRVDY